MSLAARLRATPRSLRGGLAAVALGALYLVVAYLSSSRWRMETALLWPASGLYLGALLGSERRLWPQLAAAVLAGSFGANLLADNSLAVSVGFAVPSCAEGLLGAVLVRRLAGGEFTLERVRDVAAIVAGAAVVANGLTALSAATTAVQALDTSFTDSWLRWWSADALGIAAVAPLVVVLLRARLRRPSNEQIAGTVASGGLLAAIVALFSVAEPREAAAVLAAMFGFPILLWTGWRWSIAAAALATPVLAIAVTYVASRQTLGSDPISTGEMVVVQASLAMLVVGALALAASVAERRSVEPALAHSRDRSRPELAEAARLLDERQADLNDADTQIERLRAKLESAGSGRDGALARLEEAEKATDLREAEVRTLQRQLATATSARDGAARELAEARQARERLEREVVEAREARERLRAELEDAAAARTSLRAELDQIDAERQLLARRATELIARYDSRGICLYASPGCRELLGYEPAELVGRQGAELLQPGDRPMLNRARATSGDTSFRANLRRKDGGLAEVEATFSPVRDREGRLVEIEATVRRAAPTALARADHDPRVEAPALADRDPLTGLFSRSRFEEELRGQLAAAARYGAAGAVLAVDLDRFRELNALLGHACTDDLIRAVGDAFRRRLRTTDVLGRSGDDRFAVILPRAAEAEARDVANALLEAVRETGGAVFGTGPLALTASIGIACFGPGREAGAEELLVEAEVAVQDAKESGGDSAAAFDSSRDMPVPAGQRFEWAEELRAALEEDRFVLYAQQIVSLAGDHTVRHELLPRMVGARGEMVPPAAFLPAAERLGLARELDGRLLRRAATVVARAQRQDADSRIEVGLSSAAPPDGALAEFVAESLRAAGADPSGLCVTIPEATALRGGGTVGVVLGALSELGCEVGLRDFGMGLTSFLHVERLPVRYLKLDDDLVRRLATGHGARLVAGSIAGIAGSLGMRTAAPSVRDRETLVTLGRLDIGYAQGPAVAEPRPIGERLPRDPQILLS